MTFPRKFFGLGYGKILDEEELSENFLNDLERIKNERNKVIILLGWVKTPRVTIHYYKSDTYPDLKDGMFFLYKANARRKISLGAFKTTATLRYYIEIFRKEHWWTNTYMTAEILSW